MKKVLTSSLDERSVYRVLTGFIVPRPIAWISSVSATGVRNIAPFSFFTVVDTAPPKIGFTVNKTKARGLKDTRVNIEETGEFVVNIVDRATAAAMDATSFEFSPEVDEFEVTNLTPVVDNLVVRAPRIAESPVQFECRYDRTVEFNIYSFIIGEVVAFHLRDDVCDENMRVDLDTFDWVGRLTATMYCNDGKRFSFSE